MRNATTGARSTNKTFCFLVLHWLVTIVCVDREAAECFKPINDFHSATILGQLGGTIISAKQPSGEKYTKLAFAEVWGNSQIPCMSRPVLYKKPSCSPACRQACVIYCVLSQIFLGFSIFTPFTLCTHKITRLCSILSTMLASSQF